ncbi:hypothetical protein [Streptomonospora sediminis]
MEHAKQFRRLLAMDKDGGTAESGPVPRCHGAQRERCERSALGHGQILDPTGRLRRAQERDADVGPTGALRKDAASLGLHRAAVL